MNIAYYVSFGFNPCYFDNKIRNIQLLSYNYIFWAPQAIVYDFYECDGHFSANIKTNGVVQLEMNAAVSHFPGRREPSSVVGRPLLTGGALPPGTSFIGPPVFVGLRF